MTESVTAPEEFDLDAWLDGAKRTERGVTLYARPDLLADIDALEAKLRQVATIPDEDRAYGESSGGNDLQAQIDALYVQLDASKLEFRVSFLDDTEQEAIRDGVKADLKKDADAAAAKARTEARDVCRRNDITAVNDINEVVRRAATNAADAVIEREVSLRTIAAAVVSPKMSVEQVRKLYTKVGDAQITLLSRAYTRASIEAPQVAVPKSSQPSQNDAGPTSS